jgi:hypothetical protein
MCRQRTATPSISSTVAWLFVTNAAADSNGFFQFADPEAAAYPRRFYQLTE